MNTKHSSSSKQYSWLLLGVFAVLLGGATFWWFGSTNVEQAAEVVDQHDSSRTQKVSKVSKASPGLPPMPPSMPVPTKTKKFRAKTVTKKKATPEKKNLELNPSPAMQKRFREIAADYAENIKFPKYSIKLHEDQWDLRNPMAYIPTQRVIAPQSPFHTEVELPKYRIFHDQEVIVDFKLRGPGNQAFPELESLKGTAMVGRKILDSFDLTLVHQSDSMMHWQKRYPADPENQKQWPDEVTLRLVAKFVGITEATSRIAQFRYVPKRAVLHGVGPSYVAAEHLMFPVYLTVFKAGKYRVRANLFDKNTMKPVSHLNQKAVLSEGEDSFEMKVHVVAIKDAGLPGPYILKEFNIVRIPDRPGQKREFATTSEESFEVDGQDLNLYVDRPYTNTLNQQRLQFLQQLGGVEEKP